MTRNNPSINGFDLDRANAFMKELQKESDRGAALVGNDYLDHLMKKFLEARMNQGKTGATAQDRPKRISEKLLKYPGPLSTAASRVDLAHVLGWIGPKMYADLVIIRNIRNKFAHFHRALDFNDKKIGDLCSGLWGLTASLGTETNFESAFVS